MVPANLYQAAPQGVLLISLVTGLRCLLTLPAARFFRPDSLSTQILTARLYLPTDEKGAVVRAIADSFPLVRAAAATALMTLSVMLLLRSIECDEACAVMGAEPSTFVVLSAPESFVFCQVLSSASSTSPFPRALHLVLSIRRTTASPASYSAAKGIQRLSLRGFTLMAVMMLDTAISLPKL